MNNDQRKAGILHVSPEVLCEVLGIQPGHAVCDARMRLDGALEFVITGPSMPVADGEPQPVRLLMTRQSSVVGCWEHAPEAKWTVRE